MLAGQDTIIRYKRMRGFRTLWLPGTDHAAIATQARVEKDIYKAEKKSRHDIGREEFLRRVEAFAKESHDTITSQMRVMGASCDWSREAYTLDEQRSLAVRTMFKMMYDDGLIYRGHRIVNWDPKGQTTISDDEIVYQEEKTVLYYMKYGPFTIATSRPETKFGDKYVVMHPNDTRYTEYKDGQKIELEWINGPITATVIKDEAIDMEFGSGVMTITPWHDNTDFEIAERHDLPREQVIDEYGKLLPIAGEFSGMKILEARAKIIEKLQSKGLVEKIEENYKHIVKTCYKCNSLIEPQIKEQWFLKMKPLAAPAIKAIEKNQIKFIPSHYKKIAMHWLKNIIDWNISRQIVWGIPIPGDEEGQVFDTWFSSGQWPYATLKTTGKNDFKTFFPTDVMETGGDIIFFWVSRMIMLSLYTTKKIPFKNVYLHGMVLDAKGQKMSKSKGNVINPLELAEKYGADALRMGLVVGNTPGTSLPLDENKIKGYRNFANKIWNASRFVLQQTAEVSLRGGSEATDVAIQSNRLPRRSAPRNDRLTKKDKRILNDFKKQAKEITKDMDNYRFYSAAEKIYHYFWHTFCDKIIEDSKKGEVSQATLLEILTDCLKILHPFMPFITEEIYQQLPPPAGGKKQKCLMIEKWIL